MPDTDFILPSITAADALVKVRAGQLLLVDVRKPAAAAASGRYVLGAERRDPLALGHDDPLMRDSRALAFFCVHGHEVSQFGCALFRLHDRDAVYVAGGFEALLAAGAEIIGAGDVR